MQCYKTRIGVLTFIVAALVGCASMTGSGNGHPTALERSYKKCGLAIGGGALLGAVVSKALGKDVGKGALAGVGMGGAACAVIYALEAKEDRERLEAIQRRAAESGQARRDQFRTAKGDVARVETDVSNAEIVDDRYSVCRYVDQTAEVNQQQADIDPQLWCRVADTGNWEPAKQTA